MKELKQKTKQKNDDEQRIVRKKTYLFSTEHSNKYMQATG